MAKFKKEKKEAPGINTSALPDIVFMLLFFFMVATVLRNNTLLVKNTRPRASEVTKIEHKSLTKYIYIGAPTKPDEFGTAPRIQLNDAFAEPEEIPMFVETNRAATEAKLRNKLIWSLKIDKDARMGIVTDVKQELRKSFAYKINYSSNPRERYN